MISLSASAQTVLTGSHAVGRWLIETSGLYLSMESCTVNGQAYTAAIAPDSFSGVEENRARSEDGIQALNDFSFVLSDPEGAYTAATFQTAGEWNPVTARLVYIDDSGTAEEIRVYTFQITKVVSLHGRHTVHCQDYLAANLDGLHPVTELLSGLSPTSRTPNDDYCVPKVYGTAYIPLRAVFSGNQAYYVLGPAGPTYTIEEVRSPHEAPGYPQVYTSADYTFQQSTLTLGGADYRVFQPLIHNPSGDGSTFVCGVWLDGDRVLDPLVKFSRSDTASTRNLPDVIAAELESFGIPPSMIDTGAGSSFEALRTTHAARGLTFDYGFFTQDDRAARIASLLNSYSCTLRMTDKVEIYDLDRTNRATITADEILRESDFGPSSFRWTSDITSEFDSGKVAFPEAGKPQDSFVTANIECVSGVSENRATETFTNPYYVDSQLNGRAAQLHFQRRFYGGDTYTFRGHRSLLFLQADDVVSVPATRYGGSFSAVIDSVSIGVDCIPVFSIVRLDAPLENWGDATPDAVVPQDPDLDGFHDKDDGGYADGPFPANVKNLIAEGWIDGAKFSWDRNPADDFKDFLYQINITNNAGTVETGWSAWASTVNNYVFRFLTDPEISTYGNDAIVYIQVKSRNKDDVESLQTSAANVEILSINFPPTTIDDFSITATKMFTKTVILEGDSWTDNSPSAGYVAWNAHTLVYNGASYPIGAGNTSRKYIYWIGGSGNYNSTDSYPALGDNDFMIATNISGVHDLAWNAIANEVIGTAHIMEAAITEARIADLAVSTAKIKDAAIVGAKIANASITDAHISGVLSVSKTQADVTADNIAAGIAGQGDLATQDAVAWATQVTGKPTLGALSALDIVEAVNCGSTLIAGGFLQTDIIAADSIILDKLSGASGTLTLTAAGQIEVNSSLGLVVNGGGGITVNAGGDIYLSSQSGNADADRGLLKFESINKDFYMGSSVDNDWLCIFPTVGGSGSFRVGADVSGNVDDYAFGSIAMYATSGASIYARKSGGWNARVYASTSAPGGTNQKATLLLRTETEASIASYLDIISDDSALPNNNRFRARAYYCGAVLHPVYNEDTPPVGFEGTGVLGTDFGTESYRWRTGYFRDINANHEIIPSMDNSGSLGSSVRTWFSVYAVNWYTSCLHLDVLDDIEILKQMKPKKDKTDPETGLPELSIQSLPDWMTNKALLREEIRAENGDLISDEDFEAMIQDDDDLGWRLKRNTGHYIDLIAGAVRQLDARVQSLEANRR